MRRLSTFAVVALAATAFACTTSEHTPAADSTAAAPTAAASTAAVHIIAPANGDSVTQPFTLRLEAVGVEVVPATGTAEPGKGHHHLIIDGDTPSDTLPLPAAPVVIHMGDASTEKVIEGLTPGSHRIIAVFADGMHVPMASVKRDTITVIVK
ncbi:DUF4399 domain-containing protein [Gemmatimonas aurantiaca]|uniref:DUF4399 domain-containing protein n=1 Tax=Gemmatimonas aurantiaca TaxID=173480 RepID=UPI00301DA098